jgi:hypothetical protein
MSGRWNEKEKRVYNSVSGLEETGIRGSKISVCTICIDVVGIVPALKREPHKLI